MAASAGVSRREQQHVVAVPLPAQGHINPLMRFCQLLAAQGFLVTFVNTDPIHQRIEELVKIAGDAGASAGAGGDVHANAGITDAEVDPEEEERTNGAYSIRRAHIPIDGLNLANDFRVSFQHFFDAQNSMAPHLEALLLRLNRHGPPVTCLVSDICTTLPSQKVADKFNIPWIVFIPNAASVQLLVSYATQGQLTSAEQVLEGLKRAKTDVFCDTLPGLPSLRIKDLPHFKHVVDDTNFMWGFLARTWQQSESRAHAMVINSFEELEAPTFKAFLEGFRPPLYGIGPLVESLQKESSLWKEDEGCIAWLDKQPPLSVLYISFGSITILSQPQFDEILAALISSKQRFVWVFRPDLVEGVIAHSSSALDVVMSKCNGRGYVVEWAPQLGVLSHPSVGGFLTHCGWNSVMEAIAHGIPMLCWPYFGDQPLNAKHVVEVWKIGLQFVSNNNLVERGEIERVIKALMEGTEGKILRENASILKELGRRSLVPGGSSHKNLEILVQSLHDLQASKVTTCVL